MLTIILFVNTAALILAAFIIIIIRSISSNIKKPITLDTPRLHVSKTTKKSFCPFLIFNSVQITKLTKTYTILKGTEITKNLFILSGSVDIFFKGKKVATRGENEIIFNPFDMLNVPISVTKKAATDILVCELLCETNTYVDLKYLEKLVFEPIIKVCKGFNQVAKLETLTTKNFDIFLSKNFNLIDYKPEQIEVNGEFALEECLYYVVSGSLIINDVAFHKNAIFGYFGAFFNHYKGFHCKAQPSTILKCVPYSKLRNGKFDIRILKNIPDFIVLIGITADWNRVTQSTHIFTKGSKSEYLYLVDGVSYGCKESILSSVFESDLIAQKTVDVVRIPNNTIRLLIGPMPSFYEELTRSMFHVPEQPSKIVLITASKEDYPAFYKRLARTMLSDAIFLKNKNISDILGKNVFYPVGELILNEHLKKLAENYKVVVVFLENEFSRLLQIVQPICDIIFIVGNKNTSNRFEGSNIELINLHERRLTPKLKVTTKIKNKFISNLIFIGALNESSVDENDFENDDLKINPLELENSASTQQFRRIHSIMSPKELNFCNKDYERFGRYLKGERFGLVLGGGGARGYAHIGVLRALEEENIPVDVVGGTSMGALIGALYSRELDYMEVYREAKKMSKLGSSWLVYLLDFNYPFASLFSGRAMDGIMKSIFKDQQIQNFWLEYYCIATDLKRVKEAVFFNGSAFKCVRSSMTVAGLLPPVFYKDYILCDGAYVNNLPIDVMRRMDVKNIISVKVDCEFATDIVKADSRSGLILLFKSLFLKKSYFSLAETQYRLSFLHQAVKEDNLLDNDLLIHPDLSMFKVSDFHKFDDIMAIGYNTAKQKIKEWKKSGKISECKKINRRFTL